VLICPAGLIDQWQLKYPSWNRYVMNIFRKRYDELISNFEVTVFEHIDVRVMEYLKSRAQDEGSSSVHFSHQQLADELGTTRVVISRILKEFERQQQIK